MLLYNILLYDAHIRILISDLDNISSPISALPYHKTQRMKRKGRVDVERETVMTTKEVHACDHNNMGEFMQGTKVWKKVIIR